MFRLNQGLSLKTVNRCNENPSHTYNNMSFDLFELAFKFKIKLIHNNKALSMHLRLLYLIDLMCCSKGYPHFMMALPQVNPLPKAAKTTQSPDFILLFSQASVRAIGIEAAVVFPYFWILL